MDTRAYAGIHVDVYVELNQKNLDILEQSGYDPDNDHRSVAKLIEKVLNAISHANFEYHGFQDNGFTFSIQDPDLSFAIETEDYENLIPSSTIEDYLDELNYTNEDFNKMFYRMLLNEEYETSIQNDRLQSLEGMFTNVEVDLDGDDITEDDFHQITYKLKIPFEPYYVNISSLSKEIFEALTTYFEPSTSQMVLPHVNMEVSDGTPVAGSMFVYRDKIHLDLSVNLDADDKYFTRITSLALKMDKNVEKVQEIVYDTWKRDTPQEEIERIKSRLAGDHEETDVQKKMKKMLGISEGNYSNIFLSDPKEIIRQQLKMLVQPF